MVTLIDWERGARNALREIYNYSRSQVSDDKLIDLFLQADARIIRENVFPYWNVLQKVAHCVAEQLGVTSSLAQQIAFASSVPDWPAFDETRSVLTWLACHYRLGIISNVDDDIISETIEHLGLQSDAVITSEKTASYKPDRVIFDQAVKILGEEPGDIIHIAEGRCEAATANALGMRSLWVNRSARSNDGSDAEPSATVLNLTQIAAAMANERKHHPGMTGQSHDDKC